MPLKAPTSLQSSGCDLSELRAINGGNGVTRARQAVKFKLKYKRHGPRTPGTLDFE
ncbi:hypothetical protein CaCOL14_011403 [Colletotrichum acutatum]